ncbi:MAG: FHA domain-containing protein [bacterium]|nr:FHA domain-containing protein [bacterium]
MSIFKTLREWIVPWQDGTEPMEIRRAILDEIESEITSIGNRKRIFPYNRVHIRLRAADPKQQATLRAAAHEGWDLQGDVEAILKGAGSPVPAGLRVEVSICEETEADFGDRRFRIDYRSESAPKKAHDPPRLEITVIKGDATEPIYRLAGRHFYVGRLEEVLDKHGRLSRRNDVAFRDEGEINTTVSRRHALIRFDEADGVYRLRDEHSAAGTTIFREGRSVTVSGKDRRGVRLRHGDEVAFGRAVVKVELAEPDPSAGDS